MEKGVSHPVAIVLIIVLVVGASAFLGVTIMKEVDEDIRDIESKVEAISKIGERGELYSFSDLLEFELTDTPFFEMEIESVTGDSNEVTIETTGATYILTQTGIEMWRKIDPATNELNPRKVAELEFDMVLGNLNIQSTNKRTVIILSDKADLKFNSDSFFFIEAKQPISYNHVNLVTNAPWNKGSRLDRMWTDGYGGSLHAFISGNPTASTITDLTTFTLSTGDIMSHMVFPSKLFDFEGLYGQNARPFVHFIYSDNHARDLIIPNAMGPYIDDGFGVFVIWSSFYGNDEFPELLDTNPNVLGYNIQYPVLVNNFVREAHNNGFKVINYFRYPANPAWDYPAGHPLEGQHQDIETTLQFMRDFQQQYNLDGWYFDNAEAGDLGPDGNLPGALMDDYNFMRQVRTDVSDNGIIYHHNSKDVWEGRYGERTRRAIMVDVYSDYTFGGESGELAKNNDLNEPYLRYFAVSYGMTQAYATYKRKGDMRTSISEEEKDRFIGENMNGAERNRDASWTNAFKPAYDVRKAEYLSGNFNPDVDWPIDPQTGWFRTPENMQVNMLSGTEAVISWTTNELANSNVIYTHNGYWWPYKIEEGRTPSGSVSDDRLKTEHSLTITNLDSAKNYEFRIRSSNKLPVPEEIIWGYVGNLKEGCGNTLCESDLGEGCSTCSEDCGDCYLNIEEYINGLV